LSSATFQVIALVGNHITVTDMTMQNGVCNSMFITSEGTGKTEAEFSVVRLRHRGAGLSALYNQAHSGF
jgi:hypothetical protein